MVTYRFGIDDLAAMRFSLSPVWELVMSLVALRDRETAAMHLPWLRTISGLIDGAALRPIVALVPVRGYTPDFLTPPPLTYSVAIEDELARVAATPPAQVIHDVRNAESQMRLDPAVVRPWVRDPAGTLSRTVEVLGQYWDAALRDVWVHIRGLLEADITHRAGLLTTSGLGATLGDLHGTVRWHGDRLDVDTRRTETCELAGRGLLLMPSVFQWSRAAAITRAPWQPTLIYPARGIGSLWDRTEERDEATLARIIGGARARLLTELDVPRSSTDLIRRTGMSAASVSEHLAALRAAGLTISRREGRYVLHRRSPRADALLNSG
jgi:DNA-binding transcriptional ArsR family regulator